jgi:hypothetical protein
MSSWKDVQNSLLFKINPALMGNASSFRQVASKGTWLSLGHEQELSRYCGMFSSKALSNNALA